MEIRPLKLEGTYAIQLKAHRDDRGYFVETYCERVFREHGLVTAWVQENQSLSARKGLIRGLHFQRPPHAQTKLVRVVAGAAWDVFVDLRRSSPTYGRWDALELSEENQVIAYIPRGFAHGFCTLTERAIVTYKVDDYYAPDCDTGLRWNDETLGIPWPAAEAILSPKDRAQPLFRDFVSPFYYYNAT